MSTKRPGDDENGDNGVTDTKKAKSVSISPLLNPKIIAIIELFNIEGR